MRCLTPHYARTEEEGRALIREMLLTSVRPSAGSGPSSVAGSSPFPGESRSNEALAKVCETLNALEIRYPGTELKLVYEGPGVA